ncbi:MAG: hypothetical protein FGM33_06755 [Candidatus Kapabacteria bacterium]|nr:hypothetical protein [Candidatus Kapabacteria bacterium]
MKRFLLIAAATVIVASCSQNGGLDAVPDHRTQTLSSKGSLGLKHSAIQSIDDDVTYEDFDFFGRIHNQGLEYVYETSIRKLPERHVTEDAFYSGVAEVSAQFINEVCEPTRSQSFDVSSEALLYYRKPLSDVLAGASGLSNFQKDVLLRIDTILLNARNNRASVMANLVNIQDRIEEHVDDDDKPFLFSALSVARHSANYWSDPGTSAKWLDAVNEFGMKYRGGFHRTFAIDWGKVAEADYNGFVDAVIGYGFSGAWRGPAIRGAIIGSLTTGGVGAVAAAILNVVGHGAAVGAAGAVLKSSLEIARQELF